MIGPAGVLCLVFYTILLNGLCWESCATTMLLIVGVLCLIHEMASTFTRR